MNCLYAEVSFLGGQSDLLACGKSSKMRLQSESMTSFQPCKKNEELTNSTPNGLVFKCLLRFSSQRHFLLRRMNEQTNNKQKTTPLIQKPKWSLWCPSFTKYTIKCVKSFFGRQGHNFFLVWYCIACFFPLGVSFFSQNSEVNCSVRYPSYDFFFSLKNQCTHCYIERLTNHIDFVAMNLKAKFSSTHKKCLW